MSTANYRTGHMRKSWLSNQEVQAIVEAAHRERNAHVADMFRTVIKAVKASVSKHTNAAGGARGGDAASHA